MQRENLSSQSRQDRPRNSPRSQIPVVTIAAEIRDLFNDPGDVILEVQVETEFQESADANAFSAGVSTNDAASSSDADILADASALDKSDSDLLKKLIETDLFRKVVSCGRFVRAGLLSESPLLAML